MSFQNALRDNLVSFICFTPQVKKNGEMYVSRKLDREALSSYRLEVAATDGTFVETCKVSIEILDDNDSPPICVKTFYKQSVMENANSGTILTQIQAKDADEGANAKQIFYLTGEDSDMFSIDRSTGVLKTAMPLDREKVAKYILEAHVQDAGNPEWECSSQIEVEVLDTNDNKPEWAQAVFSASLKEDLPVGTVATKIHATDADLGDNKMIRYTLLDSAKGHFKIDPISGIVTLSKPLDREVQAMYNLTVRAMDYGRPRLQATTKLIVLILDVNDNPPEFASKFYFASISEEADVGGDVVRVLATSKDSGVNADITYSIVGGNEHRKFKIEPKTGTILVSGPLDHERATDYFLTIQAQDGGDPPLSNHATVNITIQDANDNGPIFSQVSYNSLINEAAQIGEHVASVTANDEDSEENGRVSYSILSGDRHKQFSVDGNTGLITVASALDREMVSSYVLEIEASDHGTPKAQSATVLVNVDISDSNDNPPIFPEGNYTCHVQEDKPYGYVLQRFTVTDADDNPNGSPFTFDIRAGNEDNSFRVVQDGTLRTATKFNHKVKNKYQLQIRVFDNGTPPLYSDSFVTVNIIEESQYPPIVVPLDVGVWSYQDDFPGAVIAKVKASDQDPYDQLTYELVPNYSPRNLPPQSHLFEIDHNEGTVIALQGLDVGSYGLNISVSDGKFTTYSQARVVVDLLSDEMLEYGAIIRFGSISPRDFVVGYQKYFVKAIKSVMDVRSKDVLVLGVQPSGTKKKKTQQSEADRMKRDLKSSSKENTEVLFAVKKSKSEFYPREKVVSTIEKKLPSLAAQLSLKILNIQKDECTPDHCENGKCKDLVVVDEEEGVVSITSDAASFVAPRYKHQAFCQCKEGFSGDVCQIVLNECAREPCPSFKVCVPDSSFQGYSCGCSEGMTGALCNVNITECRSNPNRKCDVVVNPMSFGGKSYVQYALLRSVERHLSVSLAFKTLHATANLMYAEGIVDFSILEIVNGRLRYRFNFGSGEGSVTLDEFLVNDGEWHEVRLERHGNSAKLTLDGRYEEQGSAPGVNDVLNLEVESNIYFGAEVIVHKTPTNGEDINKGFSGCLDDIRIDGIPLPLILNGASQVARLKRFNNIEFKCGELTPPGICGDHPCQNGGTCQEQSGGYICNCPSRFTGTHCEYDLDPCVSNPCLYEAQCVNLKNDYHCECPPKLSGKRCHYGMHCNPNPCGNNGICEEGLSGPICKCRGFTGEFCTIDINECLHQNPCHNGGTCINSNGGFTCICPDNSTGVYCHDPVAGMNPSKTETRDHIFKLEEIVGIILSLFILVIIVMIFVCFKNFKSKQGSPANGAVIASNGRNPSSYHIQNTFDKDEAVVLNHHHHQRTLSDPHYKREKLNNLELAAQERPLLSPPRPLSCYTPNHNQPMQHLQQQETAFNYVDTVRSYGSAADELESLPRISSDYIQNIQKPMAAVAPSICNPIPETSEPPEVCGAAGGAPDRNLMESYFYPNKSKPDHRHPCRLRVNLPPSESPALKGAASLSSLQTSVAEDASQRYYWDSFDLNNDAVVGAGAAASAAPLPKLSEGPPAGLDGKSFATGSEPSAAAAAATSSDRVPLISTLPPPGKPVDPTRDIETLNEDEIANDANGDIISTADTEDEPQLGSVFPPPNVTKSFEELLALNDDINFVDEEGDAMSPVSNGEEAQNSYDYHLHLNNYLPTYNVSETDTDEQTPMLARHNGNNGHHILGGNNSASSPNANLPYRLPGKRPTELDTSSDMNGSIAALVEDEEDLRGLTNNGVVAAKIPSLDNGKTNGFNGKEGPPPSEVDNICQLEDDSDGDTPTVEIKPMPPLASTTRSKTNPRVTRV